MTRTRAAVYASQMTAGPAAEYMERILRARVYDVAIESPLEPASRLSRRLGNTVLLKREDMQPVFSFKLRGAYNKIANLSASAAARGVICASAGNHAQGVALAAGTVLASCVTAPEPAAVPLAPATKLPKSAVSHRTSSSAVSRTMGSWVMPSLCAAKTATSSKLPVIPSSRCRSTAMSSDVRPELPLDWEERPAPSEGRSRTEGGRSLVALEGSGRSYEHDLMFSAVEVDGPSAVATADDAATAAEGNADGAGAVLLVSGFSLKM